MGTERARAAAQRAATQVAQRQGNGQVETEQPTVFQLIEQLRPQIQRALPKTMTAERFTRIVMTTLRTNPALMQCTPDSVLGAMMLSAQLGLEPGPLGHSYFVPFKKKGQHEVTFIVGYRGIIDLARRSGQLKSIEAREVYDKDEFTYEFGLEPKLRHVPAQGERGRLTHFYGVAHFKDGGHYFEVLTVDEVNKFRDRSRAKDAGPWVTDYVAMGKKTVIRRMMPFLPVSVEAAQAVAADEGIVSELPLDAPDDGGVTVQVQAVEADEQPEAPEGDAEQSTLLVPDDECPVCGTKDDTVHDADAHAAHDAAEAAQE